MKQIFFLIIMILISFASCDGIHDDIKDFADSETVYSGMYDIAEGKIGLERVEIDLLKAGRIPASQVNLGKAKKTIVEYDNQQIIIDSVCSWVNITGLTQSKIYRFKIFTADEFNNKSVPQEVALIPYTSSDVEILSIASPRIIASPWAATFTYSNLSSVLLDYYSLSYSYTDKDNNLVEGTRGSDPQFSIENLNAGEPVNVNIKYKVVPIMDTIPILDTVILERNISLTMPTDESYQQELQNRGVQSMTLTPQGIKLVWQPVDDFTMQYTMVKFTDASNVEQSIRVENDETSTVIVGLGHGMPFTLTSNYKPEGVSDVYIDATPRLYNPTTIDLDRIGWTSTQSHPRPSDSPSPTAHLDGDLSTFLSQVKPGKSNGNISPGNDPVFFIVDMLEAQEFNYFRIRHRNTTLGLRVWGLSIYGSNDGTNFSEIQLDIDIPNVTSTNDLESPNIEIPLSTYRYIKAIYTKWDTVNNSAVQMSEFYLGIK
ncbi:MAG: discoidin domain-containing protein [Bacteroidales bacterium]|nr:discoidin domain-containing protein [Bacteroidales bacterium]